MDPTPAIPPTMAAEAISTFAQHARIFVAWAEGGETAPRAEEALRNLAALYASALLLPQPERNELPQASSADEVNPELLRRVRERAAQLPVQFYWEVFDSSQNPPEDPVSGNLVDDLDDIYRVIARGLALYEAGKQAESVSEWAFSFRIHWGTHALSAIRALHEHLTSEIPEGLSATAAAEST